MPPSGSDTTRTSIPISCPRRCTTSRWSTCARRTSASEIIPIDSLTAQKRMVEAGFGLALLQESSVNEELRAGTLCALRIPAMLVTIPVVLIHRRRAYLSGAAQALMAILASRPTPGVAGPLILTLPWAERFGPEAPRTPAEPDARL